MENSYNVLSCFDGIGGGITAMKRENISIKNYYAAEIKKSAIKISKHNNPEIIHLGDIRHINQNSFKEKIDVILSGSPCQQLSFAGKQIGMIDMEEKEITSLDQYLKLKSEGFNFIGQSYLFWEFIRLIRELKPKYFLLENVIMKKKWENIISNELGVLAIRINSNIVSIQNRDRLYWTNIPNVLPPTDKKIYIQDVIPNAIGGYGERGIDKGNRHPNGKIKWEKNGTTRLDNKTNCIMTKKNNTSYVKFNDGTIRQLTIDEIEMAQTLPIGYTNVPGVSQTERWEGIGNGWTISVISHILKNLKN